MQSNQCLPTTYLPTREQSYAIYHATFHTPRLILLSYQCLFARDLPSWSFWSASNSSQQSLFQESSIEQDMQAYPAHQCKIKRIFLVPTIPLYVFITDHNPNISLVELALLVCEIPVLILELVDQKSKLPWTLTSNESWIKNQLINETLRCIAERCCPVGSTVLHDGWYGWQHIPH